MSRTGTVYKKISVCSRGNRIRIPFPFCAAVVLAGLILYSPASAAEGVRGGLALCAYSVIPSLFPFLVLSPMLADGIRRMTAQLCHGHIGERSAALLSAYTVGMLAGFPIGALTVLSQYKQSRIGDKDAARFLGVCTGASPAFLIGYFGQSLWGCAALGWVVWLLQCLFCLAGVFCLLCKDTEVPSVTRSASDETPPTLTQCISGAVPRILQICGCVVIFSVLRAFFCQWFPTQIACILGGMTEMTGGLCDAAALYTKGMTDKRTALTVSAAVIGFGGVCVGMQIADAAAQAGISMRQYWIQRMLLGAVGVLAAAGMGIIGIG